MMSTLAVTGAVTVSTANRLLNQEVVITDGLVPLMMAAVLVALG